MKMDENQKKRSKFYIVVITYAIVLYALVMDLANIRNVFNWLLTSLSPIWFGMLLALFVNVPMRGYQTLFQRNKFTSKWSEKSRLGISLLLATLTSILVFYLIVAFILPQLLGVIHDAVSLVSTNINVITEWAEKIGVQAETVNNLFTQGKEIVNNNIAKLTNFAITTVVALFSSVTNFVLSFIFAIYLLAMKERVKGQLFQILKALLNVKCAKYLSRAGKMFISSFSMFFSRQCLESLILGSILLVGMLIFDLPYAVSIACMTAVLALIPYVGAYVAFFIGSLMLLLIDPTKALVFVIWFLVAQQIEGNLIFPYVVGNSVGLPAYLTLASVILGGALFGIAGMVLIIPIMSVVYKLLGEWVHARNKEKECES